MKKVIVALSLVLATTTYCYDFIEGSFAGFIERVVCQADVQAFNAFYRDFMLRLRDLAKAQRDEELQRLRMIACRSLEVKHEEWAAQLKPYAFFERANPIEQKELKKVRTFLTRYAVYEEFLKKKAMQYDSLWARMKTYTRHIGTRIAHLFTFSRSTAVT